jgi:hypothetical protein
MAIRSGCVAVVPFEELIEVTDVRKAELVGNLGYSQRSLTQFVATNLSLWNDCPSSGAAAATYTRPATLSWLPASVMTTPPRNDPPAELVRSETQ